MTKVVVSVGTDHHPFVRLLEWADTARVTLDLDMVVQSGATPPPASLSAIDFVPADHLASMMRDADAVVCHGGPGTIAAARDAGHRPIVVPRDPGLGEHVDDHQLRYSAALSRSGEVDVAQSVDALIELLRTPRPVAHEPVASSTSHDVIEQFAFLVDSVLNGSLPGRRWIDRILVRRSPS